MRTLAALTTTFIVFVAGAALAQPASGYVGAGLLMSTQGSHEPGQSSSFPSTGVGGTSFGISAEAGTFLSDVVSLGAEFQLPARLTVIQDERRFNAPDTETRYRDLVISALLGVHAARDGPLQSGFVIGWSVVNENALRRDVPNGTTQPVGAQTRWSAWTYGVTLGGDADFRANDRVSVVGQVRLHIVDRPQESSLGGQLGLSPAVFRLACGVRARF